MIEYYAQIKLAHVTCVILSGLIFGIRGGLMLADSPVTNHALPRFASYTNDSVLLTAGLLLMSVTHQYPTAQAWLTVKLSLLVVYIVLGVFALRRGRTKRQRSMSLGLAVLVYLSMFSIARTHHPLGALVYAF